MRIIDKNRDYYDYLQSSDDNRIVFDRRGSFTLTKEALCDAFNFVRYWDKTPYRFLLMQCGATYWLFLAEITSYEGIWHSPSDYRLGLLSSWKNFNKDIRLLDISVVNPGVPFVMPWKMSSKEEILKHKDALQNEIAQGNYSKEKDLGRGIRYTDHKGKWEKQELPYPLLKECGIAGLVGAQEIFSAIEEYFSMRIAESERTEPLGMTNNDKIEAHGFDVRTSFRGKEPK